ncbi:MAG: ABC transporter ATP-binding protein/permease, partial [Candidatus Pacebacteria bacterium]|nr:ABC transporter ATP-binding protein/permease [Candidatus Paceibacterota bacterium]
NREYFRRQVEAMKLWTKVFPAMRFLQGLGSILVLGFGAWLLLRPEPEISLGTVIAFNTYVLHLYQPIGMLFRMYDWILRSLASGERILEVLETEPEIKDAEGAVELPPVNGDVVFDHVSFRYTTGDMVLNDVQIHATPGQTIALVGHSGAGKTSMVNLIPRFFEPVSGRILIDGYDVSRVKLESLRRQIAIVLQDPFLFNGTVIDNIRYASPAASIEAVKNAAEAAYAHEFIEGLPDGYDTEIGERGIKLSGGQKQRLAIARALLADRRILILDEATAMVDSHAEYEIQQALRRLMQDRTTFVIAHRLSTVKNAHQIVTLVDGRVAEVGDHKTLMAQKGAYSEMYEAQFKLALEDDFGEESESGF